MTVTAHHDAIFESVRSDAIRTSYDVLKKSYFGISKTVEKPNNVFLCCNTENSKSIFENYVYLAVRKCIRLYNNIEKAVK